MSVVYQIRVRGCVDTDWSDWFEALAMVYEAEGNVTTFAGPVIDQAALLGILLRLHNLNLELLSVIQLGVTT